LEATLDAKMACRSVEQLVSETVDCWELLSGQLKVALLAESSGCLSVWQSEHYAADDLDRHLVVEMVEMMENQEVD